uniref:Uncharacterized protein n=1 Tax=Magallana gigas TaxID=29159 RepID=A0A8W8M493_MAGGI
MKAERLHELSEPVLPVQDNIHKSGTCSLSPLCRTEHPQLKHRNIPSRNQVLEVAASPENRQDIETVSTLREIISEMNEQTLRQVLIIAAEAEPDLMKSFIEGSRQDSNPSSEIAWCSCGRCQTFVFDSGMSFK